MESQTKNAVSHYRYLIEQGVEPPKALDHAAQRFGVPHKIMQERVSGRVADPVRTRRLLAAIKSRGPFEFRRDAPALLADLYEAITGEPVDEPTYTHTIDPDDRGYTA
jgi:hypothetical protein